MIQILLLTKNIDPDMDSHGMMSLVYTIGNPEDTLWTAWNCGSCYEQPEHYLLCGPLFCFLEWFPDMAEFLSKIQHVILWKSFYDHVFLIPILDHFSTLGVGPPGKKNTCIFRDPTWYVDEDSLQSYRKLGLKAVAGGATRLATMRIDGI